MVAASTAAALDYEVQIFFTLYGLTLLKKDVSDLKVSPLGNTGMPMPVPMPNLMQMIPGMESMATMMMKQKIANKGVASIEELRAACLESGVKLIACQMTVDLFDFSRDDFIGGMIADIWRQIAYLSSEESMNKGIMGPGIEAALMVDAGEARFALVQSDVAAAAVRYSDPPHGRGVRRTGEGPRQQHEVLDSERQHRLDEALLRQVHAAEHVEGHLE